MSQEKKFALYCVGNKLMMDDGLGSVVYEQLQAYEFPENVHVYDLACLSLDRIQDVRDFDCIIVVDAVENTGKPPGTLFRFLPSDMAGRTFGTQSLHDIKLSDLFASAMLLGYECEGVCVGMQVENAHPVQVHIGLSPSVQSKLPDLVDVVLAELVSRGVRVTQRSTGQLVRPGYHHQA